MSDNLTIPCLSLWQPWAGLLFNGKDVENRSWATNYRGPLLIHAAKKMDVIGFGTARQLYYRHLHPHSERPERPSQKHFDEVHSKVAKLTDPESIFQVQGAILGIVNLVACKRSYPGMSMWHFPDQWGWYLENALEFTKPIPYRGRQRLFRVPIDSLPCEALGNGKIVVALRLKAMHLNPRSPCSMQLKS